MIVAADARELSSLKGYGDLYPESCLEKEQMENRISCSGVRSATLLSTQAKMDKFTLSGCLDSKV